MDYQFEYRGLTIGLDTEYSIVSVSGLEEDNVRTGDTQIPRAGGDIPGLHVAAARDIIMDVIVGGAKGSQAQRDNIQAFVNAFQHSATTSKLFFEEPGMGGRRYVNVRSTGRLSPRDPRFPFLSMHKVRLKAADPRTYGEFSTTDLLTNYSATGGGLDFDITEYGKDFSVDASSSVIAANNGNAPAWPELRFYGPLTGTLTQVTLSNLTTGGVTVFDTTLLTDQILTADMEAIVTVATAGLPVIRLGAVNAYSDWAQPREPFYLAPGDNLLRFEITGGSSLDGTCRITYKDTWL